MVEAKLGQRGLLPIETGSRLRDCVNGGAHLSIVNITMVTVPRSPEMYQVYYNGGKRNGLLHTPQLYVIRINPICVYIVGLARTP